MSSSSTATCFFVLGSSLHFGLSSLFLFSFFGFIDNKVMASLVINSIRSALDALVRSGYKHTFQGTIMERELKNLELFVLCTRRLGNHAQLRFDNKVSTLGSLLQRIHDAVAHPIQPDCRDWAVFYTSFDSAVNGLVKEISQWYSTLSDSLPQPTFDEVTEFIDSVSEVIAYFARHGWFRTVEVFEALVEKITFLRNFIRFATLPSVEPQQLENLLLHIQTVTVNAAYISFKIVSCGLEPRVAVQQFKIIDPGVYETYAQALISSKLSTQPQSPTPDADHDPLVTMRDFIDFLLSELWERVQMDTCIAISTSFQLQLLYGGLTLLRTMLKEHQIKFDEEIRELTRVVTRDAGVIIFSLYQKDVEEVVVSIPDMLLKINRIRQEVEGKDLLISDLLCTREEVGGNDLPRTIDQLVLGGFQGSLATSFGSTVEDIIKDIESTNSEIHHASDIKAKKVNMKSSLVSSRSAVPIADEIVGLDDDAASIIDRLTGGSKQLKIVAILGMPGIGKTTLATKVYNHPSVTFHFHKCAWCCVSQLFERRKALHELLKQIDPNDGNSNSAEHDLSEKLWRSLKRKRYLIVLDDVWDIEVWNCLKESFPNDSYGSRIILTSRHRDAAPPSMPEEELHFLRQLTKDESFELLQRKLFPRTCWAPAFYELGKQIAENCKGLPLTVVVVAGVLATLKLEGWKNVLESLSSGFISSTEQCMNIVEMSYTQLPEYLKPCFLYLGLLREDEEVSVKRLIWLWIAEGFVHKTELNSLEDVARDYMMDLVGRNLVIVSKKRSIGGVKTCRIHDLLHDFCRIKAKEENFFQLLKGGYDEFLCFREPSYMRRLCVHSARKHFRNLRLFCPHIHSLLFFARDEEGRRGHDISFIIRRYKRLRVLDVGEYLSGGIPSEIGLFLRLKYLAVFGTYMDDIPSSIGNLSNLETFILKFEGVGFSVSLPDTFWNLQKLRHLAIPGGFHFPTNNLENSPDFCELQSCSGAIMDSVEMLMGKFPNICELKCEWRDVESGYKISIPDFLSRLESLRVARRYCGVGGLDFRHELDFPENLKKLTLYCLRLSQSNISMIGKLPNLEVLKFDTVAFLGDTWDVVEGKFSTLRFLKLEDSSIVTWTASDDQFPRLQKLVLEWCGDLEEIPACLENIDTLEMVEISDCSNYVNSFFKQIREMGNSLPKIHITTRQDIDSD